MKTGFVVAEEMPQVEMVAHDGALYQIAIVAAAVLLILSAAFL